MRRVQLRGGGGGDGVGGVPGGGAGAGIAGAGGGALSALLRAGMVTGTGGSITVQVNDPAVPLADRLIVMSPSGVQKERMVAEDMYVMAADGKVLSAPVAKPWPNKPPKCTDCAPLFMKAYLMRGAGAVIHSHGMETCIATMLNPGAKEFRVRNKQHRSTTTSTTKESSAQLQPRPQKKVPHNYQKFCQNQLTQTKLLVILSNISLATSIDLCLSSVCQIFNSITVLCMIVVGEDSSLLLKTTSFLVFNLIKCVKLNILLHFHEKAF